MVSVERIKQRRKLLHNIPEVKGSTGFVMNASLNGAIVNYWTSVFQMANTANKKNSARTGEDARKFNELHGKYRNLYKDWVDQLKRFDSQAVDRFFRNALNTGLTKEEAIDLLPPFFRKRFR